MKQKRRSVSQEEIDYVLATYANTPSIEIAQKLNRPLSSIYRIAYAHCLKKNDSFLNSDKSGRILKGNKSMGIKTQFKKGNTPPNKGKKLEDFMSPETIAKFKANTFKKGNNPQNAYKDWEEGLVKFKDGNTYIRIKVPGFRKLVFKHVWLWIDKHGSIPTGHIISFKDGNSMNCVVE
uniref:HNH endonuclease n=1 Tax=Umezakia ovalisporum TaxID=75695 RepID=UPI0039C6035A